MYARASDHDRFMETVVVNRGFEVKVFVADVDAARAWVLDD